MTTTVLTAPTAALAVLFLLLVSARLANGFLQCPNRCSGKGICTQTDYCECYEGYTGADCSLRTCPYDRSWADKPYDIDSAHSLAECSDRGICNRKTGMCRCFEGYTGSACSKTLCGETNCNGHGSCLTINEIYQQFTFRKEYNNYTLWDSSHTTMCSCDIGYTGASCQIRMCPRGDDPFTPSNGFRTITITTSARYGDLQGFFLFTFQNEQFRFPADARQFDSHDCKRAFEALKNVGTVSCNRSAVDDFNAASYTVSFESFPVIPHQNNIFTHNGNPAVSDFFCDITQVDNCNGVSCLIEDNQPDNLVLPEYDYCSNRGICNTVTGECSCYLDLTNSNCDTYKKGSTLAIVPMATTDLLGVVTSDESYMASLFAIDIGFDVTDKFNHLLVKDDKTTLLRLTGSGELQMLVGGLVIGGNGGSSNGSFVNNGLVVTGGVTITDAGISTNRRMNVLGGGLAIRSNGLVVSSGGATISNGLSVLRGGLTMRNRGFRITGGATVYSGGMTIALGGFMVFGGGGSVAAGGMTVNKRGVSVYSGGLVVGGGIRFTGNSILGVSRFAGATIESSGLVVSGGITVFDGGLSSGIGVAGMSIASGGLNVVNDGGNSNRILSGGLYADSASINSGGLPISGLTVTTDGLAVERDGLSVTGGVTIYSGGISSSFGTTITSNGLAVTGGLTASVGDFFIDSGSIRVGNGLSVTLGISVGSDGLISTGGSTIFSNGVVLAADAPGDLVVIGGARFATGLTVLSEGFVVTGAVTIDGGVFVAGVDGMTVASNGLVVTTGMTAFSGGLAVTGGASVFTGGLRVTSGTTIFSGGLNVLREGLSIGADGLIITGGSTITSGGMLATGGVTILSGGFRTGSGATIASDGMYITGSTSIGSNGLSATGGLTIRFNGMRITGGESIASDGMTVTGGMTISTVGLAISTGGSVFSSGMIATGGMTILTGSIVTDGGMAVRSSGLLVRQGGFNVLSDGLVSASGLTVGSSGLAVTGGLTVQSLGSHIASGLTISSGGILTTGGITVGGNGLFVSGGMSISNGITMSDRLDVASSGVTVTGGMTSNLAGLSVSGGVSVLNDGLVCDGFVTISSAGITSSSAIPLSGGLFGRGGLTVGSDGFYSEAQLITFGGLAATDGFSISTGGLSVVSGVTTTTGGLAVSGGATISALSVISADVRGNQVSTGVYISGPGNSKVQSDGLIIQNDLRVNGFLVTENTIATSDENLKTGIEVVDEPLLKLAQLRGVYYNWLPSEITMADSYIDDLPQSNSSQFENSLSHQFSLRHVGLIAQEVQRVLPEVVRQISGTEYLGVMYENLVALAVEGIHEIDERSIANENAYLLSEGRSTGQITKYSKFYQLCKKSIKCRAHLKTKIAEYSKRLQSLEEEKKTLLALLHPLESK